MGCGYLHHGGTSTANILPYFSADNLLTAVAGDDHLADAAIGRITARLESEVEGIMAKLLNVEENPATDAWNSSVLFISDRGKNYDASEALNFEAMNDIGAAYVAGSSYSVAKLRYWSDICQGVPANCDWARTSRSMVRNSLSVRFRAASTHMWPTSRSSW